MRFMVILKADRSTEAGIPPSTELLAAMGTSNEELVKAGVMLAGEGLQPSAKGARIKFCGGKRTLPHRPSPPAGLLARASMLEVTSHDAAPPPPPPRPAPAPRRDH